jgi:MarR-like DNA-binding transcriptional regulator SgrR of sgrS sRNA
MKRVVLLLLAVISAAGVAVGATRPHYGGVLRVEMCTAPNALVLPDPSDPTAYWDIARVLSLVGDTLVRVDAEDRPQPALAIEWQRDATARHWQFVLRHGVKFHDGSAAAPAAIAQILGALHPNWVVQASSVSGGVRVSGDGSRGDSVTIETDVASPFLPAELAMPRNLILKRDASGVPIGTGPFRVTDFQAARMLKLAASDESWAGRPFADGVEIEFGKSLRDEALALDLGRADLVETVPEAAASMRSRVLSSLKVELMALVFTPRSRAQDARVREALALSIDRRPIQSVLLKGAGEPAASILPNWMIGYGAAFSTQPNLARAKNLLAEARAPELVLNYDARDPGAELIAERIALNAREAGITVRVSLSGAEDIRLVRIALPTPDPALALREAARELALAEPVVRGNSVEELYFAEHSLLEGHGVIPLFHLPVASAAGPRVRGWSAGRLGLWDLADVWLEDAR